jgi:hypothetical protein
MQMKGGWESPQGLLCKGRQLGGHVRRSRQRGKYSTETSQSLAPTQASTPRILCPPIDVMATITATVTIHSNSHETTSDAPAPGLQGQE